MDEWKKKDVPEIVRNMIEELIKREKKMVKPHQYCMISFWIFMGLSIYMLLDFFMYFIGVSANAFQAVVHYVLSGHSIFVLLLLSLAFSCYQYYRVEEKKKEDKFERLRAEVIESVRTDWPLYLSNEQIKKITEQIKKKYQINLFFKG